MSSLDAVDTAAMRELDRTRWPALAAIGLPWVGTTAFAACMHVEGELVGVLLAVSALAELVSIALALGSLVTCVRIARNGVLAEPVRSRARGLTMLPLAAAVACALAIYVDSGVLEDAMRGPFM